jgi:hypothetical protein
MILIQSFDVNSRKNGNWSFLNSDLMPDFYNTYINIVSSSKKKMKKGVVSGVKSGSGARSGAGSESISQMYGSGDLDPGFITKLLSNVCRIFIFGSSVHHKVKIFKMEGKKFLFK